jgi:T-complex protein 1 subunit gamma
MLVLNQNTQRDTGRSAQLANIGAAQAVAGIVRSTLGPRAMLKMLLDPMGGIVITNDANAILREVDVSHPAAKQMIELSRAQDEEVGDGTTSVIVLTGEMLQVAEPLLQRNIHPTMICRGYARALDAALGAFASISKTVDLKDNDALLSLVQSCIGTKFSSRWGDRVIEMAVQATLRVVQERGSSTGEGTVKEVDIKRYAKVEKVPGGEPADSRVLRGVMFNKDVTHPRMRRKIVRPRVLLLDCPLEYKKGDSNANVEITKEEDWNTLLRIEEEYIEHVCAQIVAARPDVVITEKGVSDLAQHYLMKANITAFRRLRKTDNNRVARATGATICSRTDEIQESDVGTQCGLFEVRKLGDEYFAFLEECDDPKACTLLLRGGSKDVLMEVERNLQDAMQVIRNVVLEPRLLPGGGAAEMAVSRALRAAADAATGVDSYPLRAVADAMEVIPRILATNCGAKVVRVLTELRAKQQTEGPTWGIDGTTGKVADMNAKDGPRIWEPYAVKVQTVKTAIEAASLILRVDDIVSGIKGQK